jgi:hypothetical protein
MQARPFLVNVFVTGYKKITGKLCSFSVRATVMLCDNERNGWKDVFSAVREDATQGVDCPVGNQLVHLGICT